MAFRENITSYENNLTIMSYVTAHNEEEILMLDIINIILILLFCHKEHSLIFKKYVEEIINYLSHETEKSTIF